MFTWYFVFVILPKIRTRRQYHRMIIFVSLWADIPFVLTYRLCRYTIYRIKVESALISAVQAGSIGKYIVKCLDWAVQCRTR